MAALEALHCQLTRDPLQVGAEFGVPSVSQVQLEERPHHHGFVTPDKMIKSLPARGT